VKIDRHRGEASREIRKEAYEPVLCHILNAACKIKAVKCIASQEQQTDLGKSLENIEPRPQQGRDLK
jgi:hypothetical protein